MTEILIRTEQLSKTFRSGRLDVPALFDIDLEVNRGEFVAVMGPSGCGKSTLLHILGLMLAPSRGRVILDGADTTGLRDADRARLRRERIGFVFQRFNLLGTLSAYQNIAVAEKIRGRRLDGQVDRVLAAVGVSEKAHFKPGQLSMGQQQRVAIARAVAKQPEILLCDEPTGALDYATGKVVLALLHDVNRTTGTTVVIITHNAAVGGMADRVVQLKDGRVTSIHVNESPLDADQIEW